MLSHLVMTILWDPRTVASVHGILQARILKWVAIVFSRSSWPRDWTQVSCIAGRFFIVWASREALLKASYPIENSIIIRIYIYIYILHTYIICIIISLLQGCIYTLHTYMIHLLESHNKVCISRYNPSQVIFPHTQEVNMLCLQIGKRWYRLKQ